MGARQVARGGWPATPEEVEDVHRLRALLGVCANPVVRSLGTRACFGPDDRLDVYGLLVASGLPDSELEEACRSSRSGHGPTAAEIRAGDYARFPFQRRRYPVPKDACRRDTDQALLWDPVPQRSGWRILGGYGGRVYVKREEEFASYLARLGGS